MASILTYNSISRYNGNRGSGAVEKPKNLTLSPSLCHSERATRPKNLAQDRLRGEYQKLTVWEGFSTAPLPPPIPPYLSLPTLFPANSTFPQLALSYPSLWELSIP